MCPALSCTDDDMIEFSNSLLTPDEYNTTSNQE